MSINKPIFTMIVGLPGSGKSTYAERLATETGAFICSSDEIRKELCGDVNSQEHNEKVFRLLHSRVKDFLRQGKNVIYDATNIHSKRRRGFLNELKNISCIKACVIMATPFKECCSINESRDRTVPYKVIKRMYMNWNTPYWFEGWDNIFVKYKNVLEKRSILSWLGEYLFYDQENRHHSMGLGSHCINVGKLLSGNKLLVYAGFLHDCGKPFTKTFVNTKGEITDVAHYYQHHCVGAYDSLFYKYHGDINALDVSILINLHMQPFCWEQDEKNGERISVKYKNIWGDQLYEDVMKIHEADKMAH